jgi:hypothetical protein
MEPMGSQKNGGFHRFTNTKTDREQKNNKTKNIIFFGHNMVSD